MVPRMNSRFQNIQHVRQYFHKYFFMFTVINKFFAKTTMITKHNPFRQSYQDCSFLCNQNSNAILSLTVCSIKSKFKHLTHNIQIHSSIFVPMSNRTQIAQLCDEQGWSDLELVIQSCFDIYYKQCVYSKMRTWLYPNSIKFQIKSGSQVQTHIIKFCFDLLFELISQPLTNKKKWSLSTCYSIRLQLFQKFIEFRSPQEKQHLALWRDHLAGQLNQRGFHQQFCPIKELGQGYFANVYQVLRFENKATYAVKAFNKEDAYATAKGKEAIVNQINIMRSINHPNLMKMFGVFQSKNSLYLCVQLLAGGHLLDEIIQKEKFSSFELRKIMKSILLGLQALHSKGVMHRDLKPQNILLRDQNSLECVIADFGLAQHINSKQALFIRCGTPGFVAPQILSSIKTKVNYNCSCDMYSLGIILYHLLFGRPPFRGKNTDQILELNKLSKFNFEDSQYININSTTLSLLKGLLQKDPSKRLTAQQALEHQFFCTQNKQILQSYEPEVKEIKEMKTKVMPKKELKVRQKKNSLQYQQTLISQNNQNTPKQKLSQEQKYSKFNMKDQISTCSDELKSPDLNQTKSPLATKKVPKVRISDRSKLSNGSNQMS